MLKNIYHICIYLVERGIDPNETIACTVDADCLTYSQLMKCSNSICGCQMGFHLDGTLCGSFDSSFLIKNDQK